MEQHEKYRCEDRRAEGAPPGRLPWPLVFLAALAAASAAAAPSSSEAPRFGEVMDVQLVSVEAVVVDAAGQAVLDLQPGDFRLFEDDAPVPLEHVELVGGGGRAAAAPAPGSGGSEGEAPLHLAVFIDEVHVGAASRRLMLRQMSDVLARRLRPEDRVLVAVYDGSTRVVLPFTA